MAVSRGEDSSLRRCPPRLRLLLAALLGLLPACHASKPPDYQDETGVRFAPPPGWVERDRPALLSGANRPAHRESNLPLPQLDAAHRERLLVRYDRLTSGDRAWVRLSLAAVPARTTLESYLVSRFPPPGWRREGASQTLEVIGKPATRNVWKGNWLSKDYLCEMTAVRHGEEVYLFTASFPADDPTARAEVRQAIATAVVP